VQRINMHVKFLKINSFRYDQNQKNQKNQNKKKRTINAREETRDNHRARKKSFRSWMSLCPIVATRDNGWIHNIVHLQARPHTCTLDDTLFKYLVMNGRALAREHLTYAPLHDRMLHISYIRRQRRSLSPLAAGCASFNLGEFAGRSREH